MGKHYSEDLKNLIVNMRMQKKSYQEIATLTSIPKPSVYYIIRKYEEKGTVVRMQGSGRKKILGEREINTLLKIVKKILN